MRSRTFAYALGRSVLVGSMGVASLAGCAETEPEPPDPPRPDVVVLVIDTLRADHLSFLGGSKELTPFLSELAARAVVLDGAHATSSWTAPSTASLFTSLLPIQHGLVTGLRASRALSQEVLRLPEGVETLPELFRANGYRTVGVTDNMNVSQLLGFDRGFEHFRSHHYKGADAVDEALLTWRDDIVAAEEPVFLYLHYMDPHAPYTAQEPWFEGTPEEVDGTHAAYESEIRALDDHVRAMFEAFGWARDTLVVFTADHGEEFGDHGGEGHGTTLYGEMTDVPLFFHWPERWGEGRVVRGPVSLVDVLPTLAGLLGLSTVAHHEGRDLTPVLDGEAGLDPLRPIYAHLDQAHPAWVEAGKSIHLRSLVVGDEKLIVDEQGPVELYDLAADPGERTDLAAERPERAAELLELLRGLEDAARTFEPGRGDVELSEEELDHLRAIGYGE